MSSPGTRKGPDPADYDSEKEYMAACMANPKMTDEFPEQEQRAAVCYRYWRGESVDQPPAAKHRKVAKAEMTAHARGFTAVITTDSLDLDGEVLVPDGMDATHFLRTRTVFWNHDYNRPVGVAEKSLRRIKHGFESTCTFASRPDDYQGEWFPDFARAMVDQGVISAVSIGFDAINSRLATREDEARYGKGVRVVHGKWKLLEYSLAPIPANSDALITAVRKSLLTSERAKAMFKVEVPPAPKRPAKKLYVVL